MNKILTWHAGNADGSVHLPASKSISNRVLLINALSDSSFPIENLADCDDTNVLCSVLNSADYRFDVGHAGTAMRFLTAFLARIVGRWELTGSERMQQRPIAPLVDALNQLGARIEYAEREGFPPLRIYGSLLRGGTVELTGNVSSQYISALMMVAPYMVEGLKIRLLGDVVSAAYIRMTLSLMREFGAVAAWTGNEITVAPVVYRPRPYRVESDWSAASYFYELASLSDGDEIHLSGLYAESIQGDAQQVDLWDKLGVSTTFRNDGVHLHCHKHRVACFDGDFTDMPDLVPSFVVACCLLDIPCRFSGVTTLRIKETDRIAALVCELAKLGYALHDTDNELVWDGERCLFSEPAIATYEDHRMAMAFAPAATRIPNLTICNSEVVTKSFPGYWKEMRGLGLF